MDFLFYLIPILFFILFIFFIILNNTPEARRQREEEQKKKQQEFEKKIVALELIFGDEMVQAARKGKFKVGMKYGLIRELIEKKPFDIRNKVTTASGVTAEYHYYPIVDPNIRYLKKSDGSYKLDDFGNKIKDEKKYYLLDALGNVRCSTVLFMRDDTVEEIRNP